MNKTFLLIYLTLIIPGAFGNSPFYIQDIEVLTQDSSFRTKPQDVIKFIRIKKGDSFSNLEDLEEAVAKQQRDIEGTRYFYSVQVEYELLSPGDRGTPVLLTVTLGEELVSLVPIPYFIPDSQVGINGWRLGLKLAYRNAFGSMTDFYFDGRVMRALGEDPKTKGWRLRPELANISLGRNTTLSIEYTQVYETRELQDAEDLRMLQKYTSHSSFLQVQLDYEITPLWVYNLTPSIGGSYGYNWSVYKGRSRLDRDESGNFLNREDSFSAQLSHGGTWGEVNWMKGIFRQGHKLTITNKNSLNLTQPAGGGEKSYRAISDLEFSGLWYQPFLGYLNYYTRGSFLIAFNDIYTDLGTNLRGVKDTTMAGNTGVFWQNTLAIQLHRPRKNINLQLHPFVDLGFSTDYQDPEPIADIIRIGTGGELIILLGSVDLRARVGYDLSSGFIDYSFSSDLSY